MAKVPDHIKKSIKSYIVNYNRSNLPAMTTIAHMFPYERDGRTYHTSYHTVLQIMNEIEAGNAF